MELEAFRKEDSSWHPCRISLSSGDGNVGVIVDFENEEEEDVIGNKEDALLSLRYRSSPLKEDECASIKEGECVLALQKTKSKSLFIDATIEEPKRVKHSKRVHCRCTFEIKWLSSELQGETVTVPSNSILKLSDRSIDEHPVISRFLNVLNSENGGETPSVISFSEESHCEAEFIGILEKQVEEISKLVDGSKASFTDPFLEVKSGTTATAVNQKSKTRDAASQRSTRSQNKHLLETEVKRVTETKPVLTPLAARAALASLVHELPEKSLGFSGEQDFKHKDSQQSDTTGTTDQQSSLEATSNSVKSTFDVQNKVLSYSNPFKRTNTNTNLGVKRSHDSSDMSTTLEKEMNPSKELYGGIKDEPFVLQHSRNSVNGEETTSSTNSRRLTRSMQKELEVSSLHMKQGSPSEMLRNTHRQTRSGNFAAAEEVSVPNDASTKKPSGTKQIKKSTSNHDKLSKNNAPTSDTGNKAEELVMHDSDEIKKIKVISNFVDLTFETDLVAERIETPTKRRTRSSCLDEPGSVMKREKSILAVKKSRVSSRKDFANLPLRSSPRLACSSMAGSQAII